MCVCCVVLWCGVVCVCVCVCVYVWLFCVVCVCVCVCLPVCVCVCERERERECACMWCVCVRACVRVRPCVCFSCCLGEGGCFVVGRGGRGGEGKARAERGKDGKRIIIFASVVTHVNGNRRKGLRELRYLSATAPCSLITKRVSLPPLIPQASSHSLQDAAAVVTPGPSWRCRKTTDRGSVLDLLAPAGRSLVDVVPGGKGTAGLFGRSSYVAVCMYRDPLSVKCRLRCGTCLALLGAFCKVVLI